jgi:hypothetical protein
MSKFSRRSILYPGSVAHFRSLMQHLYEEYEGLWRASNGQVLSFEETPQNNPTRSAWEVHLRTGQRFDSPEQYFESLWDGRKGNCSYADVAAYERSDGYTLVVFADGHTPYELPKICPPIGPAFAEFVEMIVLEIREATTKEAPSRRPIRIA